MLIHRHHPESTFGVCVPTHITPTPFRAGLGRHFQPGSLAYIVPATQYSDMHAEAEGLDGSPSSDEGEIVNVDANRYNRGYQDGNTKACEACGDDVAVDTVHIGAWVRVGDVLGDLSNRPVFCDEGCWAAWATASEKSTQVDK